MHWACIHILFRSLIKSFCFGLN